jgi:hypothetical protein
MVTKTAIARLADKVSELEVRLQPEASFAYVYCPSWLDANEVAEEHRRLNPDKPRMKIVIGRIFSPKHDAWRNVFRRQDETYGKEEAKRVRIRFEIQHWMADPRLSPVTGHYNIACAAGNTGETFGVDRSELVRILEAEGIDMGNPFNASGLDQGIEAARKYDSAARHEQRILFGQAEGSAPEEDHEVRPVPLMRHEDALAALDAEARR